MGKILFYKTFFFELGEKMSTFFKIDKFFVEIIDGIYIYQDKSNTISFFFIFREFIEIRVIFVLRKNAISRRHRKKSVSQKRRENKKSSVAVFQRSGTMTAYESCIDTYEKIRSFH